VKIFVAHSSGYDYTREFYEPLRNSQIDTIHKIFLPNEKNGKPISTKNVIKNSDVVIAEVSCPSTGQGIELGWANTFNIPIICIYKKGVKPASRSLKYLTKTFISYKNKKEMIVKLENELASF